MENEERAHYQILVGRTSYDSVKVDVICNSYEELEFICYAIWAAEVKKRRSSALCMIAKKGGDVSFRNFDYKFEDCM